MHTLRLTSFAALLVLLSAAPASAELALGDPAPDVTSADYINTEPVKLPDLSGRLILLELFKTT
jgi:hypothetical protein